MSSHFRVVDHVVPCNHIRQYPRSTRTSQETVLYLAIKQYIPLNNPDPQPGDVTIIGAHANGFPKELYEPLWEDLLQKSQDHGFRIRSIWIADLAFQGVSGLLNAQELGNDVSWHDHALDLLHIVNTFRADMPRPIVGVGHSIGGFALAHLANIHPRLFETLALIDPVMAPRLNENRRTYPAVFSSVRKDQWPTRQAAAESFRKSPFYGKWDPRVLDLWMKFGLRELPSSPQGVTTGEPAVTLVTSKDQEVLSFSRPMPGGLPDTKLPMRVTHPDYAPDRFSDNLVYRPEASFAETWLPYLRPSVLYITAEFSEFNTADGRQVKLALTGSGRGGSGGAEAGRVKYECFMGIGHLIPMEDVGKTGTFVVEWLGKELKRWREIEAIADAEWAALPEEQRYTMPVKFKEGLAKMLPPRPPRQKPAEPAKL